MGAALQLEKYFSFGKVWQINIYIFTLIVLSGCNPDSVSKPNQDNIALEEYLPPNTYSIYANKINNVLLAELYSQFGQVKLSAKHYQNLVVDSKEVSVAKRATILAAISGQQKEALNAVRLWVDLVPDSLEARQYYSLLLLRNREFNASVEQLHFIRSLVESDDKSISMDEYSKGLKFIGSMLNIESHHHQSLIVYQHYIKKYGTKAEQDQQNLILSSLAMNAKKHDIVLSALNSIENKELKNSSKIVLMKVKALQGQKNDGEAVKILKDYVDRYQSSDSIQLQLVRLLILDQQKEIASPYLKALVRKYPDNNDLLKSLIALEIDQEKLQSAKNNLKKLKKAKEYLSDVAYFMGEISEAEGDLQSALKSYQQVVGGSLQKRAMKKIIKLSKGSKSKKTSFKQTQ